MTESLLKFVPFVSCIENGFWTKLAENKLNLYKLDDSKRKIKGFYTNSDMNMLPCRHTVEYDAFLDSKKTPPLCYMTHGTLYNKNTIEDFKSQDKKTLLTDERNLIWDSIQSGAAIVDPSLLVRFVLLSFSDLKKYKFYYWFCFPSFVHKVPIHNMSCISLKDLQCDVKCLTNLQNAVDEFQGARNQILPSFFLITYTGETMFKQEVKLHSLEDFSMLNDRKNNLVFGYCDPSTMDYPGWPLRNYLTLISYHWAESIKKNIDVLCLRDRTHLGKRKISHSLFLNINMESIKEKPTEVVGWEKNNKNKLIPKSVDLTDCMDPKKLAESSVDLNLKLMKWRLMPALDLDKIALCKCLLLGSGTLGCNIARGLMGWGVKNITLVDNGTVSFSNPVRQALFEFSDCSISGGRLKSIAAADRLKKIFPGVNSKGIELSIPMPGHPIYHNENMIRKVKQDVEYLENLIDSHDAVFLLMDTRESRWLPTLLSAAKNKLVINAALGFDSYLVMRHGVGDEPKLGCYFCNDVVAPGNSTRDRSLDQQCTVSRPGVSMIAAALAVELLASVLQHPSGPTSSPVSSESCLGPVPHQIRGFLSNNQTIYPTTNAFSKCTGCSQMVIEAYKNRGFDFMLDVFNSTHNYLEDLTGLTLLHQESTNAECDILEFSDSESI